MIVIHNHADGTFSPIHYPRKSLPAYLSQQVKSVFDLEEVDSIKIEFNMLFHLELPKSLRVSRFVKNKLKCYFGKDYTVISIPTTHFQIAETEGIPKNLSSGDTLWKDIIILPTKLERALLRYMDKFKEFTINGLS